MHKSQCRNTGNVNKQGNMTHPNFNNSIVTNTNDSEMDEISDKE
jgi:hypothetical protein